MYSDTQNKARHILIPGFEEGSSAQDPPCHLPMQRCGHLGAQSKNTPSIFGLPELC
jgi:hypothetical protein